MENISLTEYIESGQSYDGVVWLHNQGVASCYLLADGETSPLSDIRYDENRKRGRDVYVTRDGREFVAVARPIWGGYDSRTPGMPVVAV